jgi:glycosyltransferase involved in cell wall biosynthesis
VAAVSVVLPTYERADLLAQTLDALLHVEPPDGGFEVVVVDDGSSPAQAAAVERLVASAAGVRLVRRANGGPAAARNAGIAASSAPLVAFLDDDCRPTPSWLIELVRPFADDNPMLAAVGGAVIAADPETWAQRFCTAVEYATGTQPVFENAQTSNACYRRDVLEHLGGFDEGFRYPGGDDPDLSFRTVRAGYTLVFAADAVVSHSELSSYRDYLLHMFHRGIGEVRIGTKLGRRSRVLARLLLAPLYLARTTYACWVRTRPKGPLWLRIVWGVLEVVGHTAFLLGTAVGLAKR